MAARVLLSDDEHDRLKVQCDRSVVRTAIGAKRCTDHSPDTCWLLPVGVQRAAIFLAAPSVSANSRPFLKLIMPLSMALPNVCNQSVVGNDRYG